MEVALMVGVPVGAFLAWAVVFDLRRRRREEPPTDHDPESALIRARAKADEHGGHAN